MTDNPTDDPRFTAALDMVGRTGASSFQLWWSDDEQPVVWIAVATYEVTAANAALLADGHEHLRGTAHKIGCALDPLNAVFDLCDKAVDGGQCAHCHRPTGFVPDLDEMPASDLVCWYQWDPELLTFRRGCE